MPAAQESWQDKERKRRTPTKDKDEAKNVVSSSEPLQLALACNVVHKRFIATSACNATPIQTILELLAPFFQEMAQAA
eukprot:4188026-Amphidinium_carterae.1